MRLTRAALGLPRDVLVEIRWRLGDEVMAIPIYEGLHHAYPDTRIHVLCNHPDLLTGNPHVHTPAMDRIAALGTRFERAYVTQPLCLPCRSSMQTGRYPHELGNTTNKTELPVGHSMLGKLPTRRCWLHTAGCWLAGVSAQQTGFPALTPKGRYRFGTV